MCCAAISVGGASAAVALAVGLLTRFLLRELAPTPALLMVIAAVILLAPHILARPHALTLPIMVAWAAALVRCMDRRAPPPYWALPLLVLWANLHGSVVLALGLIGPAVLEALLEAGFQLADARRATGGPPHDRRPL